MAADANAMDAKFDDINLESGSTEAVGQIINVVIKNQNLCTSCKTKISADTDSMYIRCPTCQMKLKVNTLVPSMLANLSFKKTDGTIIRLSAFSSTLNTFLVTQQKEIYKNDADQFENYLLDQERIKIQYDEEKNVILTMKICRDQ